jgi:nitrite reductase/ring-hydroxylating ferredoxin subunit
MPWTDAGPATHDPAAPVRRVSTPAGDVAVIRVGAAWVAVEDHCSHAGCPFSSDGSLDGDILVCDCHGSEFDPRSGVVLRGPAEEPIATYRVRRRGDRLEVDA